MDAKGKVALVTGASAGIGKASALALLREGYRVVLTARRRELLDKAIAESGVGADRALAVTADVGDPASVRALFAKAKEKFGRLDVLFNNAGMGAPAMPMEDLPFDKWQAVVAANLTGDVPLLPGGDPHHEGADAEGRAHHQQRLHLGARAAPDVDRLYGDQARGHGHHQDPLARRTQERHRVLPDRHRQRRRPR